MSAETDHFTQNSRIKSEFELRVIALDSKDTNRLLVPQGRFRLPKGLVQVGTQIEQAARLDIISQQGMINLPPMTSVARLQDVDDIKGYVIEPVTGSPPLDLRYHSAFSVAAYDAHTVLENAQRKPELFDPIDIAFVEQFVSKAFRRHH